MNAQELLQQISLLSETVVSLNSFTDVQVADLNGNLKPIGRIEYFDDGNMLVIHQGQPQFTDEEEE